MKLEELQAALNAEQEEKLCRGLTSVIRQILEDHYPSPDETKDSGIPRPPEELCIFSDDEQEEEDQPQGVVDSQGNEAMPMEDEEAAAISDDDEEGEGLDVMGEEEDEELVEGDEEEYEDDDGDDDEEEDASVGSDGEDEGDGMEVDEDGLLPGEEGLVEEEQPPPQPTVTVPHRPASKRGRQVKGVLAEYLASSPQAAEVMGLWNVRERKNSRRLQERHTSLLACILRCLRGTGSPCGAYLCKRLLGDRMKDLQGQLLSSHRALMTTTLRLFAALARYSPHAAREVSLKVRLSSKAFIRLVAPDASAKPLPDIEQDKKKSRKGPHPLNNPRPAALGLIAALVQSQDLEVQLQVTRSDRLMDLVFRGLSDDPVPVVRFLLPTIDQTIIGSRRFPVKDKIRLLTGRHLENIRRLFSSKGIGGEGARNLADLADHSLRSLLLTNPSSPLSRRPLPDRLMGPTLYLLHALAFTSHTPQQTLLLDILKSWPGLVEPYMRRLEQIWEAKSSLPSLIAATAYGHLLREAPVPAAHIEGDSDETVSFALSGILPPALTKKELTKAILSQEALTQRSGLLLIYQMLDRVFRACSQPQVSPPISQALRLATSHRLPDSQALLSLRARFDNTKDGGRDTNSNSVSDALYALVLRVLRRYHQVLPEAMGLVRFDFLRLIPTTTTTTPGGTTPSGLASLTPAVQWELLLLLDALGPQRLGWLPHDNNAWRGPWDVQQAINSPFAHLSRLLLETTEERVYDQVRSMLVDIIVAAQVIGVEAEGSSRMNACTMIDSLLGMESVAVLELGLRLARHHSFPFNVAAFQALQADGGQETSPDGGALIPALLLLVAPRSENDAFMEGLANDFHSLGLPLEKLRGRLHDSQEATLYVRTALSRVASLGPTSYTLISCVRMMMLEENGQLEEEWAEVLKGLAGRTSLEVVEKSHKGQKEALEGLKAVLGKVDKTKPKGKAGKPKAASGSLESLEGAVRSLPPDSLKGANANIVEQLVMGLSTLGSNMTCLARHLRACKATSIFRMVSHGAAASLATLPLDVILDQSARLGPAMTEEEDELRSSILKGHLSQLQDEEVVKAVGEIGAFISRDSNVSSQGEATCTEALSLLLYKAFQCGLDVGIKALDRFMKEPAFSSPSLPTSIVLRLVCWFRFPLVALHGSGLHSSSSLISSIATWLRSVEGSQGKEPASVILTLILFPALPETDRTAALQSLLAGAAEDTRGSPITDLRLAILQHVVLAESEVPRGGGGHDLVFSSLMQCLKDPMAVKGLRSLWLASTTADTKLLEIIYRAVADERHKGLVDQTAVEWCWAHIFTVTEPSSDEDYSKDLACSLLLAECVVASGACHLKLLQLLASSFAPSSDPPSPRQALLFAPSISMILGAGGLIRSSTEGPPTLVETLVSLVDPLLEASHTLLPKYAHLNSTNTNDFGQRLVMRSIRALKGLLCLPNPLVRVWYTTIMDGLQEEEGQWEEEEAWVNLIVTSWLSSPKGGERSLGLKEVEALVATFYTHLFHQVASSLHGGRQQHKAATMLSCLRTSLKDPNLVPILRGLVGYNQEVLKKCRGFCTAVVGSMLAHRAALPTLEMLVKALGGINDEGGPLTSQQGQMVYNAIGGENLLKAVVKSHGTKSVLGSHDAKHAMGREDMAVSLLRVLTLLVSWSPEPLEEHLSALLPSLMAGYQASLSERDQLTARLLAIYTRHGIKIQLHTLRWRGGGKPLLDRRGPQAEEDSAVPSSDLDWVLDNIRQDRVFQSLEHFPVERSLLPGPGPWEMAKAVEEEGEEMDTGDESEGEERMEEEDIADEFDGSGEKEEEDEAQDEEEGGDLDGEEEEEAEQDEEEEEEAEESQHRRSEGMTMMDERTRQAVYDPSFLLPLVLGALAVGAVRSLARLVDDGILSFVLISLASRKRSTRMCAYSCLHHIHQLAQGASSSYGSYAAKDRGQLVLLLHVLRDSLSHPFQRLPYCVALFLARSAFVLTRPANDVYVGLNSFLLRKGRMDLKDLPAFYNLFFSSRPYFRREQLWVLRLMKDSLHTEEDLDMLRRRHCLSLLLTTLQGSEDSNVNDPQVKSLMMEVIHQAAKVAGGAAHLIIREGYLAWAHGVLCLWRDQLEGRKEGGGGGGSSGGSLSTNPLAVGVLEVAVECLATLVTEEAANGDEEAGPTPILPPIILLQQYGLLLPTLLEVIQLLSRQDSARGVLRRMAIPTVALVWYLQWLRIKVGDESSIWGTLTDKQAVGLCQVVDLVMMETEGGARHDRLSLFPDTVASSTTFLELAKLVSVPMPTVLLASLTSPSGCLRPEGGPDQEVGQDLMVWVLRACVNLLDGGGLQACCEALHSCMYRIESSPACEVNGDVWEVVGALVKHPLVRSGGVMVPSQVEQVVLVEDGKPPGTYMDEIVSLLVRLVISLVPVVAEVLGESLNRQDERGARMRTLLLWVCQEEGMLCPPTSSGKKHASLTNRLMALVKEVGQLGLPVVDGEKGIKAKAPRDDEANTTKKAKRRKGVVGK